MHLKFLLIIFVTYLSGYQNRTRMSQNSVLSCQQKGYYMYWYFKRIYRIKLVPFCPLIPKSVQQLLPAILMLFLRNNLSFQSFWDYCYFIWDLYMFPVYHYHSKSSCSVCKPALLWDFIILYFFLINFVTWIVTHIIHLLQLVLSFPFIWREDRSAQI